MNSPLTHLLDPILEMLAHLKIDLRRTCNIIQGRMCKSENVPRCSFVKVKEGIEQQIYPSFQNAAYHPKNETWGIQHRMIFYILIVFERTRLLIIFHEN